MVDTLPVFELRFYSAQWAGPALQMRHIFDEVSVDIRNYLTSLHGEDAGKLLSAVVVDVDEQPELADRFTVQAVPTIQLLDGNEPILSLVGARPKIAVRNAIIESIEKRGNIAVSTNKKE